MAWTLVIDDLFARANTSSGAAGTTTGAGNGWIDSAGGTWSIQGGKLVGATSNPSGYLSNFLKRPLGEAAMTQRIFARFVTGMSGQVALGLRGQSGGDYYIAEHNSGGMLKLSKLVSNGATGLDTFFFTPVAGHVYTLDFSATGINPTVLRAVMTDVTTSGVVADRTVNDSAGSLQAAGVPLLVQWGNSAVSTAYSEVATYVDSGGGGTATIVLSPASIGANSVGNVVAVTGTATAFTGSPFTLSGGVGAAITSQSVSSGTAGTITVSAGTSAGTLTITDTLSGAAASLSVATSLGPIKVGVIGDSLLAGTNGDCVGAMTSYLTSMGYTPTVSNRAVSGAATSYWLPGAGSNLANAIVAFDAAGIDLVMIALGGNDFHSGRDLTVGQHTANMRQIVAALLAAGKKVVLNKFVHTTPSANISGTIWPADINDRYSQSFNAYQSFVDGVRVFNGDTGGHQWSTLNASTIHAADLVHLKDAATNAVYGQYLALGLAQRFGGVLNRWTRR